MDITAETNRRGRKKPKTCVNTAGRWEGGPAPEVRGSEPAAVRCRLGCDREGPGEAAPHKPEDGGGGGGGFRADTGTEVSAATAAAKTAPAGGAAPGEEGRGRAADGAGAWRP